MNELIKYFYNHTEHMTDSAICKAYNCKSGSLAELCFSEILPNTKP